MNQSERTERIEQLYNELRDNSHSDWRMHQKASAKRDEIRAEIKKLCEEERA